MKKALSVLLTICLVVCMVPLSASAESLTSGTCGDNLTWNFDESTGTLTISGTGEMDSYASDYMLLSYHAPWNKNELGNLIKTVKIDEGVTSIGANAFCVPIAPPPYATYPGLSNLSKVILPSTLTTVNSWAFDGCESLTEIHIPKNVTSVSGSAFSGCNNLKITVDEKNTTYTSMDGILYNKSKTKLAAFPGGRTEFEIPKGVVEIGDHAFAGSSLTSVTFPDSLTTIGPYAFSGCAFVSLSIGNNVKTIAEGGFGGCSDLTSVTFGSNVTSIGVGAFSDCDSLTSVYIPKNVVSLGEYDDGEAFFWDSADKGPAFPSCDNLKAINVDSANPAYSSIDGVLFSKDKKILYQFPTGKGDRYTVPDGVAGIAPGAFALLYPVVVSIPRSVTGIGGWEFRYDATLYVEKGSYAEQFAKDRDIPYINNAKLNESLPTRFSDVPAGAYYTDSVTWAIGNDITQGTRADKFSPNASCTRAQAVTFMYRAEGSPRVAFYADFSDVTAVDYFNGSVDWAVYRNITEGTGNGKFSPNEACTRAQIVTFLWRAAGSPVVGGSTEFSDVDSTAYYANAVKWAVQNGITEGTSATTFSPNDNCTRAQIVSFLYRAYS